MAHPKKYLGIRPVHVHLEHGGIPAKVEVSEMMGSELHLHLDVNGTEVVAVVPTAGTGNKLQSTEIQLLPEHLHLFDVESEYNLLHSAANLPVTAK